MKTANSWCVPALIIYAQTACSQVCCRAYAFTPGRNGYLTAEKLFFYSFNDTFLLFKQPEPALNK